jgi:1-acyl-sn-glycerol-3-phosphate acyltransferase
MNPQHLFKYSKSYAIVKKYATYFLSFFYKNIVVVNPENVLLDKALIFAPNHQNALMDALAVICTTPAQPVFMARADIFKKRLIIEILTFLKIIPVYRIRDGKNNLSQNDESFNIALHALECGQQVGIMPEGNHGDKRVLRPLKKGIVRLAFSAQEKLGSSRDVLIVPVGLEYSNYSKFRSKLLVIFGKPIEVKEYWSVYAENPPKAFGLLQDRLAEEMKKYMLNIDSPEHYDIIFRLTEIYTPLLREKMNLKDDFYGHFLAKKHFTDQLVYLVRNKPSVLDQLQPLFIQYSNGLKRLQLEDSVFDFKLPKTKTIIFEILRYLTFLPFCIIAAFVNIVPFYIIEHLSNRISDTQFRSSYKFVLTLVFYPVFYLLLLLMPFPLLTKLLIIISAPILGILSYDYFFSLKGVWHKIRYFRMMKENNQELAAIKYARDQMVRILDGIFL